MNKLILGVFIVVLAILSLLVISANTIGAPSLAYVYSDSMEPVIQVNDAFIVWPEKEYEVGDIIMYRPQALDAEFITHRIVEETTEGFGTWGDNSPSKDQDAGEPYVTESMIVGKIVEVNGAPLIFPQLGKITASISSDLRKTALVATGFFLSMGLFSMIINRNKKTRKNANQKRMRLRDVYRIIGILFVASVLLGVLLGSKTHQVRLLVSDNAGDVNDRIQVGQIDTVTMDIENKGLIPVYSIIETYEPFEAIIPATKIPGLSTGQIQFLVNPITSTGYVQGYIKVTNYPMILPGFLIEAAHGLSPLTGLIIEGIGVTFWTLLFFTIVDQIPGFYGYIPLSQLQSNVSKRKWKRLKGKIIGGRRERSI